MPLHILEECPHNPTFEHIGKTLDRLDSHGERQALAMEELAKQGVMVISHEKRLDKHDQDINEAFEQLRIIGERHAKDEGAEEVIGRWRKFMFWVADKLSIPVLMTLLFFLWVGDKFNWFQRLVLLWKEMKG